MTDSNGKKITAKIKAQDILMEGIAIKISSWEDEYGSEFTEKELKELRSQIKKQADRVAKLFGFDKAWGV